MSSFDFGRSLQDGVTTIVTFVPKFVGALLVLFIGYLISKAIGKLVTKALHKVRFDRSLHTSSAGNAISRMVESPSRLVGKIVFWLIYLAFISFAVSALNLAVLNTVLAGIYAYVPHIIAAIAIFLVASAVSVEAVKLVQRVMGKTALAKMIGAVIPAITMSLAVFMILNELNIAKDIINILFTAIVGSAALGMALAFGLGGRDVAKTMLEQAVGSAKENSDMMKSDLKRASANAKAQAQMAKNNLQG